MLKHARLIAVAVPVLFLALAGWFSAVQGQPPAPPGSEASVLLLRNGQTLAGRVVEGDEFFEVIGPTELIRVRKGEVAFHCRDLAEVYARKRALVRADSAGDHLELARWCCQSGLLREGGEELAEARRIDSSHPMIALMERQLQMAATQPAEPPAAKPAEPIVSARDLDRLTRNMPARTLETFVQVVQPVLLNNCTTSGCHGPSSPGRFHLMRMPSGTTPTKRLTQRNLYAALQWIDRSNPGASPLLTVPLAPHGTAKAAVFNDRQVMQYRQLVDWAYRVTQTEPPVERATYLEPEPPRRSVRSGPARAQQALPRPGPSASMAPVPAPPGRAGTERPPMLRPASGEALPGQPADVTVGPPGDPFDPELFNRHFAPPQPPATERPSP